MLTFLRRQDDPWYLGQFPWCVAEIVSKMSPQIPLVKLFYIFLGPNL